MYKNEKQLTEFITKYLDTFFEIKNLPLSDKAGDLYCKEELNSPVTIDGRAKSDRQKDLNVLRGTCLDFRMRDGAVEVDFEILNANDPTDWFGIFFRGDTSQPGGNYRTQTLGSYLVYVRQNGLTEIVEFPGPQRVEGPAQTSLTKQTKHSLRLEVENNEAQVYVDGKLVLTSRKLWRQAPGSVLFAAFGSEVLERFRQKRSPHACMLLRNPIATYSRRHSFKPETSVISSPSFRMPPNISSGSRRSRLAPRALMIAPTCSDGIRMPTIRCPSSVVTRTTRSRNCPATSKGRTSP